ncbi:MAG: hypothetical protein ACTS5I_11250 [Rhodanobacter sp.]
MPNGWEKLGEALAGVSSADREDIRTKTINALAARDYNVERAKGAIMKQRELESLGETFRELGIDSAEAVANAERAGVNLNTMYGGLEKRQTMGYKAAARDQAAAGNFGGANAELFGVTNTPQALAAVQGGMLLGNRFVEGGDIRGPTDVGQSTIRANDARAQASLITANKPRSSGGSSGVKLSESDKKRRDHELRGIEKQIDSIRSLHGNPPSESASPLRKAKYKEAMDQLDVLQQQWNETMDRYDGKVVTSGMEPQGGIPYTVGADIPPEMVAEITRANGGLPPLSAAVAPAGPAPGNSFQGVQHGGGGSGVAVPASKTDYDQLPAGTPYRAPDGSIRIKK